LTLVDNALLLPGMPIYVRGNGFTANNTVDFTYDTSLPCHPSDISTDTQGTFALYLMLDSGVKAGVHSIAAYDVATKRSVTVTVSISPLPIGKVASPTPTHAATGVTPTATTGAGGGGVFPTPVGQTPIPIPPTVGVTPTVAPTQQPTPTIGVTPSPTIGVTPTVGTTPTVVPSATPTGGKKHTSPAIVLQNTLSNGQAVGHFSLSIWLWLAILGYALSMTMLGCAGLLYRRSRRMPSR
jgi:hypothetical protein